MPLIAFDALELATGWRQGSRPGIGRDLRATVAGESRIPEGGPGLPEIALPRAGAVLRLDPPDGLRAWRPMPRPWKHIGRTRPELPRGNAGWPLPQDRLALRGLRSGQRFRCRIAAAPSGAGTPQVRHGRTGQQKAAAIEAWRRAGETHGGAARGRELS